MLNKHHRNGRIINESSRGVKHIFCAYSHFYTLILHRQHPPSWSTNLRVREYFPVRTAALNSPRCTLPLALRLNRKELFLFYVTIPNRDALPRLLKYSLFNFHATFRCLECRRILCQFKWWRDLIKDFTKYFTKLFLMGKIHVVHLQRKA